MGGFYYNTNGFPFHRLPDVVDLLADLGYDGLALTPDVHHLDPLYATPEQVAALAAQLRQRKLGIVLETGARFVLDPRRKHRPSLLDDRDGAAQRLDFLVRCVELADQLDAPVVSVWSGTAPPGLAPERCWERLVSGLRALCETAARRGIRIGFEPEPGMHVEHTADFSRLKADVDRPSLALTLDVGHCLATREGAPQDVLREYASDLCVVQLDDHRLGVHDHLMFGEGEVDFVAIAHALDAIGFKGPLEVELSRHGATAPQTAASSLAFLRSTFSRCK